MSELNQEQLDFINRLGIPLEKVFNATGRKRKDYREIMEDNGYILAYGVTPCKPKKHQLRNRFGNCVMCRPDTLSYIKREHEKGYVYVAVSFTESIVKIGASTNCKDRIKNLNVEQYANISDWQLIGYFSTQDMGEVERQIQELFKSYKVKRTYYKNEKETIATEIYQVDLLVVINSIKNLSYNFDFINEALAQKYIKTCDLKDTSNFIAVEIKNIAQNDNATLDNKSNLRIIEQLENKEKTNQKSNVIDKLYQKGYIYIAVSCTECVVKVGTSADYKTCVKNINIQQYGNIDDWVLVGYFYTQNLEEVEQQIKNMLVSYQSKRTFYQDGKLIDVNDIYNVDLLAVINSIKGLNYKLDFIDEYFKESYIQICKSKFSHYRDSTNKNDSFIVQNKSNVKRKKVNNQNRSNQVNNYLDRVNSLDDNIKVFDKKSKKKSRNTKKISKVDFNDLMKRLDNRTINDLSDNHVSDDEQKIITNHPYQVQHINSSRNRNKKERKDNENSISVVKYICISIIVILLIIYFYK